MRDPHDIIKTSRITEKATNLGEKHNQYVFRVDRKATKQEIRYAVKKIFNKTVEGVNTMQVKGKVKASRVRGKLSVKPSWKKAIVTLKQGEKIELL